MTKTQDRQVYLDVAKGMGMLGVVASHCLVETSLGILSDWYGFFMLAVLCLYRMAVCAALREGKDRHIQPGDGRKKAYIPGNSVCVLQRAVYFLSDIPGVAPAVYLPGTYVRHLLYGHIGGVRDTMVPSQYVHSGAAV